MKLVFGVQILTSFLGYLVIESFCDAPEAKSYLFGAGLILLSFMLMGFAWNFIFKQKFIALSGSVIVFKYAILGIITYKVVSLPWINLLWFAMGLSTLVIPAIAYAINEALKKQEDV